MEKELKEYTCPHCGEKQTTVLRCETATEIWRFELDTKESSLQDTVGGDFESYACPNCNQDLPDEIGRAIDIQLFS